MEIRLILSDLDSKILLFLSEFEKSLIFQWIEWIFGVIFVIFWLVESGESVDF